MPPWIWLGVLVFLVHDAEEVATVQPWLEAHAAALPVLLPPLASTTTRQFALGAAILLLGYVLAAAHGIWMIRRNSRSWPLLGVTGIFLANGLAHLLQAVYFRGYSPGVATAVLLALPYGYALLRRPARIGLLSAGPLVWCIGFGMVLQLPLLLAVLAFAGSF